MAQWTDVLGKFYRTLVGSDGIVEPALPDRKTGKLRNFKNLPSQVQKIWDFWLQENYDTKANVAQRKERYKDIDFAVRNDTILGAALNLYADEVVQADTPSGVLIANAKDHKVANACQDTLNRWGMHQEKIRVIAYDTMKYGDGFTIKSISPSEGITDQTVLDPSDIFDRVEFSATRFDMQKYGQMDSLTRVAKLQKVAAFLRGGTEGDTSEISEFFKSYLFGFTMMNGLMVPPWMISHFRIQTSQKEIWPFGLSDFSHSMSTFRQLVSSKNLQGVARALSLPVEIFNIKTDEEMTTEEIWNAVQEAKEQYENAGTQGVLRDDMGLNNRHFMPMDFMSMDVKERNHNLNDIADIEYLRDDLIMSTLIPKGYLIVDKASFGTSGTALLQQYKPFGRRVFSRQSIIMRELANDLRMHFALTNQFDGLDTEFELEMNFPQIEESRDRIQTKGDTFRLAKDVYDGVKLITGIPDDTQLSPDVTKNIFSSLSFLTPKEIDSWIDTTLTWKKKNDILFSSGDSGDSGEKSELDKPFKIDKKDFSSTGRKPEKPPKPLDEATRNRLRNLLTEDKLNELVFDSRKRRGIGEYVENSKHRLASWIVDSDKKQIHEDLKARKTNAPGRLSEAFRVKLPEEES